MARYRTDLGAVLAVVVFTAPVWALPLLRPIDLWKTDDGSPHLFRTLAFARAQMFAWDYPRWAPDFYLGYGYPVFNYYSSLTYAIASTLYQVAVPIYTSFIILSIFSILLGAVGAGTCLQVFWPSATTGRVRIPAITAAVVYVGAPYPFITNLYLRGDLPESLGLGILPWFLILVYRVWHAPPHRHAINIVRAGLTGAVLLLTHALSAIIVATSAGVLAVSLAIAQPARARHGFALLGLGAVIAVGSTTFSVLPMLLERDAVLIDQIKFPVEDLLETLSAPFGIGVLRINPDRSPYGATLSAVDWTFAFRYPWGPSGYDGPVKPGAVHIAIAAIALLTIAASWRQAHRVGTTSTAPASWPVRIDGPLLACVVLFLGTWFFNTNWSSFIWESIDPLRWLQFPSRLYGPFSLAIALLAGRAITEMPVTQVVRAGIGIAFGGTLLTSSLIGAPLPYSDGTIKGATPTSLVAAEYAQDTWAGLVTSSGEFTPATVNIAATTFATETKLGLVGRPRGNHVFDWLYPPGSWTGGTALVYRGQAEIVGLRGHGLMTEITVEAITADTTIALHQLWFPGWRAYVDGRAVSIRMPAYRADEDSLLGFQLIDVPEGRHVVTVIFGATSPRLLGDAITAGTMVVVTGILARTSTGRTRLLRTTASATLAIVAVGQLGIETWRSTTPGLPPTVPDRILMRIADEVRGGRARIDSPTGSRLGPDAFVDVGWMQIGQSDLIGAVIDPPTHGGRHRRWLFMHPPSRVEVRIRVPDRDTYLQSGIGLRTEAWTTDYGDGVRFIVEARVAGETTPITCDLRLNPRALVDERRWVDIRVPLERYVGREVTLTLRTDPVADVRNDWAGWGNPVIVVDHGIQRPVNGPRPSASTVDNVEMGCRMDPDNRG